MRALIFDGTSTGLVTDRTPPVPAAGEALIRTVRAGVGSTDLEAARGMLGFSGVLGHEFTGVVERIEGEDPAGLVGKRVVGAITTRCGVCDMCQSGLGQQCRQSTMLGLKDRDGCLADRFTLPARNLVPVPDGVDDDHAVFAEPLAAAIQALRQLTIEGRPYITVLGDGPLGLLMVQVMARLNATVRLVGRYTEKLTLCEKWGIKHRHVDDIGRRADQDIVVDCTGTAGGLELALRLVRLRGTVVRKTLLAPEGQLTAGIDLTPLVLNEIRLIGSSRGPLSEAVALLARQEVDVISLISRRMKLEDGPGLLAAAEQPGMMRILVTP